MPFGLTQAATDLLAQVQSLFGADNVTVTSGQGSRIGVAGGSKTSQHPSGNAFDFHVAGYSPDQVQSILATSGIKFGQSIQEYGAAAGAGLNHLGVGTAGRLTTGVNGKYTTTGYASTVASGIRQKVNDAEAAFMRGLGFSDKTAKVWTNPDATVGDVVGTVVDWNGWFGRIALGVFAILLIAVALFMLTGKSVSDVAAKVPPVVPV